MSKIIGKLGLHLALSDYHNKWCNIFLDQARDTVAIDDLNVVDKPCETGYFVIRDYSQLIATSQKGDYIYSPLMYTDDGYAFQIKVSRNQI